jgi:hypothetical protein
MPNVASPLRVIEQPRGVAIHLGESPDPLAQLEENQWESRFFARRQALASIDSEALSQDGDGLLEDLLASLGSAADELGYDLTELRIDIRNSTALPRVEEAGFRLVESRVTLTRLVEKASVEELPFPGGRVRRAHPTDMQAMAELTSSSLVHEPGFHSRFKNPSYFAPRDAERYYAAWVDNFVDNPDFDGAVIEVEERVAGFQLYARVEPYQGETRYRGVLSIIAADFRGSNGLAVLHSFIYRNLPEDRFYWEGLTQLTNFSAITSRLRSGGHIVRIEHIFYRRREGDRC